MNKSLRPESGSAQQNNESERMRQGITPEIFATLPKLPVQLPLNVSRTRTSDSLIPGKPPEKLGVDLDTLLSNFKPEELRTGTIHGYPIRVIREVIEQELRLMNRPVLPEKERRKRLKNSSVYAMLMGERAARGEVRGSKEDQEYIQKLVDIQQKIDAAENVLPSLTKKHDEEPRFKGWINPELRKKHDSLQPALRRSLLDFADQNPDVAIQNQLTRVLGAIGAVDQARSFIDKFRGNGKPIGMGLVGDQAVIGSDGLRLYKTGASKKDRKQPDSADLHVTWEDFANGNIRVSVAPSSLDTPRAWFRRLRGKQDEMPATVIISEEGSGRRFNITIPGGNKFANEIRKHAASLATAEETQKELETLKESNPTVREILRRLDDT